MSSIASQIIELLQKTRQPMTAMEIINHLFPGKGQPYINSTINLLTDQGVLLRHNTRPYTVELVMGTHPEVCADNNYSDGLPVKNKPKIPDKGNYLKQEFNDFWNEFFDTEMDYYSKIPFEKLIRLKMAVRNINNLVTYESTIMAAELIIDVLNITNEEKEKIISTIESTSENANGYDIEFHGDYPFVCEVKGNIPSGGKNVFGAAQKEQILKDIKALIFGKSKSPISGQELHDYYKFMCFYSVGEISIHAIQNMITNLDDEIADKIEFFTGQKNIVKDKVYVICVAKK